MKEIFVTCTYKLSLLQTFSRCLREKLCDPFVNKEYFVETFNR